MTQCKEVVPAGYKETEVGVIPEDWESVHLDEILSLIRNGTTAQQVNFQTSFIVSRIETISDWDINYEKTGYLLSEVEGYKLQKFDILLSHINSIKHIGKNAMYFGEHSLHHGMNLILLRINWGESISPYYIRYLLSTPFSKSFFEKNAKPAINQASLGKNDIIGLPLSLPPLPEQHRIAAVLSTLDEAIEQTDGLLAKLRDVKAGLMQDLLTKGIDEAGRVRSEETHAFKDSELGRVPAEWGVVYLGEILSLIRNGTTAQQISIQTPFMVSRIETISDWNINYDKTGCLISEVEGYKLQKFDILLSHINSIKHIGKNAMYFGEHSLFHGMNLMLLRINWSKSISPYYIRFLLSTPFSSHFAPFPQMSGLFF